VLILLLASERENWTLISVCFLETRFPSCTVGKSFDPTIEVSIPEDISNSFALPFFRSPNHSRLFSLACYGFFLEIWTVCGRFLKGNFLCNTQKTGKSETFSTKSLSAPALNLSP
jgi:hypothetical protein